ncbi:hypothetical protein GQA42_17830 [Escherichia coli]|nr:hypothetical protein GP661_17050 [Escherichia coli]MZQ05702.1 hypothetical protein [Escherichia coli]
MLEQQTWDNVPGVNTTNFLNNCRSPASIACYTYSMKDRLELLLNETELAVSFTGDGRDAAEILRTLPPLK